MGTVEGKVAAAYAVKAHVEQLHPNIEIVNQTDEKDISPNLPIFSPRQLLLRNANFWTDIEKSRQGRRDSENDPNIAEAYKSLSLADFDGPEDSLFECKKNMPKSLKKIHLKVKSVRGVDIEIVCDPYDTVSEAKQLIEQTTGIAPDTQNLRFHGENLEDQRVLSSYGIIDGFDLELVIRKRKPEANTGPKLRIKDMYQDGRTFWVIVAPEETVKDLKNAIEAEEGYSVDRQNLIFVDKSLSDDGKALKDYGVTPGSTVYLVLRVPKVTQKLQLTKEFFHPSFDYDFRGVDDTGKSYKRGGLPYERPTGAMRFALKVLDMFEDNVWLGEAGTRNDSTAGEWAVAYHGARDPRAAALTTSKGLTVSSDKDCLFTGIYCTASPKKALEEAAEFEADGHKYKMIVQARVDRSKTRVVKAEEHGIESLGEYWTVETDEAIRPYGICVYACD